MVTKVGRVYKQEVEVLKMKNDKPTVIKVNDVVYRMDIGATEKENKAKALLIHQKRNRLRQTKRID